MGEERLELSRENPHGPKPCAYANSATPAKKNTFLVYIKRAKKQGKDARHPGTGRTSFLIRMELVVDLTKMPVGDMGIDLRSSDTGMPQHLLHGAQVGTMLKKMRRKGMPQ